MSFTFLRGIKYRCEHVTIVPPANDRSAEGLSSELRICRLEFPCAAVNTSGQRDSAANFTARAHCTPHTAHRTPHTAHRTLHTAQSASVGHILPFWMRLGRSIGPSTNTVLRRPPASSDRAVRLVKGLSTAIRPVRPRKKGHGLPDTYVGSQLQGHGPPDTPTSS